MVRGTWCVDDNGLCARGKKQMLCKPGHALKLNFWGDGMDGEFEVVCRGRNTQL